MTEVRLALDVGRSKALRLWAEGKSSSGFTAGRVPAAAFIAALSICEKDGLIPHARQGGKGVLLLAVVGSKLDGTGLEKEHMGHIQVTFFTSEDADAGVEVPRKLLPDNSPPGAMYGVDLLTSFG